MSKEKESLDKEIQNKLKGVMAAYNKGNIDKRIAQLSEALERKDFDNVEFTRNARAAEEALKNAQESNIDEFKHAKNARELLIKLKTKANDKMKKQEKELDKYRTKETPEELKAIEDIENKRKTQHEQVAKLLTTVNEKMSAIRSRMNKVNELTSRDLKSEGFGKEANKLLDEAEAILKTLEDDARQLPLANVIDFIGEYNSEGISAKKHEINEIREFANHVLANSPNNPPSEGIKVLEEPLSDASSSMSEFESSVSNQSKTPPLVPARPEKSNPNLLSRIFSGVRDLFKSSHSHKNTTGGSAGKIIEKKPPTITQEWDEVNEVFKGALSSDNVGERVMSTEKQLLDKQIQNKLATEEHEFKLAKSKLDFEKRKKQQQELEEVDQSAESSYSARLKTQSAQKHEKPAMVPKEQSKLPVSEVEKSKLLSQMVDKIIAAIDKDKNILAMGDANSRMLMKDMRPFLNVTNEKISLMEPPNDENIKKLVDAGKAAFGEEVILICFDPAKKNYIEAQAKKYGVDFADTPAKLAELKAKRDGKKAENNLALEPPHTREQKKEALKKEIMDKLVKSTLERVVDCGQVPVSDTKQSEDEENEESLEDARFKPR
jgi:hypothetical protein